ncbi:MAG: response regulator transcription factor [Thermodesulfovibrionales bacterium]
MIRVLIADDHMLLREGLKLILSDTEDIVVVAEASDGQEVLDKVEKNNLDVIVLDINMPRKTGVEVLAELKAGGNKIPVLILSTYSAEDYKDLAIREGASGYLSKEEAPELLIDAIRDVFQNK